MASDYLLEIEGIKGESKDKKHPGTIEIHSFSWGVSNAGSMASGSGGGAGKASFSDLSFMSTTASQSPLLMLACATGQHIKSAKLFVRKQGSEQHDYYVITLSDILVSSFQHSGSDGSGGPPSESFSLNFTKIEYSYSPQKPDGSLDTAIKGSWNLKENVK
ncbi:MAG: type VI secretion system tube protein Hcp [Gemmatales bacterium]